MINFPRLTMRNINRIVLLMALAAPIVYLFGTQFTALAGAHGETVLAHEPDVVGQQYLSKDDCLVGYLVDLQTGNLSADFRFFTSPLIENEDGLYIKPVKSSLYESSAQVRIASYDENGVFLGSTNYAGSSLADYYTPPSNAVSFRVTFYKVEFYDGFYLNVPSLAYANYSSDLFSSMFRDDNFLVEWGNNSISNEPYGFAPIGTFFKYLDDNLLHFSANGAQFGLMSYGYMYYAAHVLLFDLVFYCGTFFISLIKGIVDKFTGGFEK